jgi:acyl-CoA reductase-like NAD-dependent aldehyde dehydrogenase
MLIGGERIEGTGAAVEVVNPATEEVIGAVRSATESEVDAAVKAARGAFKSWRNTPAPERGEMLHGLSTWIGPHTESLAETLTREGGKPLVENRDDMGWSASCLDFYAEMGRMDRGRIVPSGEVGQLNLVVKEPYGPVAAIVPWNYSILLLMWKLAPALAAGNTVVVKPSPYTPLSTIELAKGISEIFPPGVVNVVTGKADTGRALVANPDVALIAFTGSVDTGKHVAHAAADRLPRSTSNSAGRTHSSCATTLTSPWRPEVLHGPRISIRVRYAPLRNASTFYTACTTISSTPSWSRRPGSSWGTR